MIVLLSISLRHRGFRVPRLRRNRTLRANLTYNSARNAGVLAEDPALPRVLQLASRQFSSRFPEGWDSWGNEANEVGQ